MVEFALVVPLILMLVFAIVEVAVVARTELALIHAAREGAREAAVSPDTSRAIRAVRGSLASGASRARISVSRPSTVGQLATVRVTLPYRIAAPLFGGYEVSLTSTASMRVER